MRPEQSGGVLRLAGRRGGFSWQSGFAVGTPPPAPAFRAAVTAAAQDASAVAASLGLDRSTRRLIQQGLRNEGFDAGAPDGLFGPRTRAAIRAWQAAREQAETGYLDGMQAETLRAAGAPDSSPVDASASAATLADPAAPAVRAAGSSEAQGSATPSPPLAAPAIVEALHRIGVAGGELRGMEHPWVLQRSDRRGGDRLPCRRGRRGSSRRSRLHAPALRSPGQREPSGR